MALVFIVVVLAPLLAVAKVINVSPPQPLLAVGRSNISGKASVAHCHERFAELLQNKIDACRAAGGYCYCRDDEIYRYHPS